MHMTEMKHILFWILIGVVHFFHIFSLLVSNIICYCLSGDAEFFAGPARGERGGEEKAGGGHCQSYTAGGGSDWSYPEGPSEGN